MPTPLPRRHPRFGFTLIESLVSIGIFAILLGLVVANYQRGNVDSILSREAALLASRVRLAQESTAAGTLAPYCSGGVQEGCGVNSCNSFAVKTCHATTRPAPGGDALFFDCTNHLTYALYAERFACTQNCYDTPDGNFDADAGTFSDDIITSNDQFRSAAQSWDTKLETYALNPVVAIKDIKIVESGTNAYFVCEDKSSWKGGTGLPPDAFVPNGYPLQATVRFLPPDGRTVVLTDNVSRVAPNGVVSHGSATSPLTVGNPWLEIDIMLQVVTRPNTDCRVVHVTQAGVVSQYLDSDCTF